VARHQRSHGAAAHGAGHPDCAAKPVRAPPSPTVPGHVARHRQQAERGGVEVQEAIQQRSHGAAAHRAGHVDRGDLLVRAPPSPTTPGRVRRHPGCGLSAAAAWGYRNLDRNGLTGTLPTELGTLTALTELCVRHPHPPRLDACTVTGLWAERGGGLGVQVSTHQRFHGSASHRAGHHGRAEQPVSAPERSHGAAAHRAGHHGRADQLVRAPPSPTVPGRVRRHRVVG
jgi:hypothetical protein